MSLRDDLGVLRDRNFGWFFWSRLVNTSGGAMATVALAFAVLEIDDSASALGQVVAARSIPLVVFLLLGGVIADRFPRAAVLQISNILTGLSQAAAATLVISGHAEIWMLIVLEAVNGSSMALAMPAYQGLIAQLAPPGRLQQANVLLSMSRGALTVVGPSIAAVLVVTVGPGWALAFDALTWLVAAAMLLPVRLPPRAPEAGPPTTMVLELREGWTFFRGTTWLWVVVVAFCFLNAIQTGVLQVLAPPYAKHTIGVTGWGLASSAESVGLFVMTLALMRLTFRYPLRAGMLAISGLAVPMLVLGLAPHVVPIVLAFALGGATTEIFSLGWSLAMMENVPDQMMSRAWSYDSLGSFIAMPVGQLAVGPVAGWFGDRAVFIGSGVIYLVICLATLCVPAVVTLQRAGAPGAAGSTA